jgi:hypothetical protein
LCFPINAEVLTNISQDIQVTVFIPGTRETVDFSGPLHLLLTLTVNGNNASGKIQSQPQGLSGTSSTGAKYQGTGVTEETFTVSLQNGQAHFTMINNFRIIGQGQSGNLLIHATVHVTINANGTATAVVDGETAECT